MASQQVVKLLSSENNAIFMCYKCIDRLVKLKQNSRKSTDLVSTVRSIDTNSSHRNLQNQPDEDNATLSNMLTILKQMNTKLSTMNDSNDELKQIVANKITTTSANSNEPELSNITLNITRLHAKLDHHIKAHKTAEANNNSAIIQKLNDMNDKIILSNTKMTAKDNRKISVTHHNKNKDPLDWSFSFNQSIVPNDNSEIYQLLSGFEKNTWTSFDYLSNKLNHTMDTVLNIESMCKSINSDSSKQCLQSPVADSIKLDIIQTIQDKCEVIENKLTEMGISLQSRIYDAREYDHNDFSMQQLQERFVKLLSHGDNVHLAEHDFVPPTTVDESVNNVQNCPVIDELLTVTPSHHINLEMNNMSTTARQPLRSSEFQPELFISSDTNIATNKRTASKHSLAVNANKKELYLSRLANNTTVSMIESYMNRRGLDMDNIRVTRLVPMNRDISTLTFVSFKIDTTTGIAKLIQASSFWPSGCFIKDFVRKQPKIVNIADSVICNSEERAANFFQEAQPQRSVR